MCPICWEITFQGLQIWDRVYRGVLRDFRLVMRTFPKVNSRYLRGPMFFPSGAGLRFSPEERPKPLLGRVVAFNDEFTSGDDFVFPYNSSDPDKVSEVMRALKRRGKFESCCDTDCLPYTVAVMALLLLANERLGAEMGVRAAFPSPRDSWDLEGEDLWCRVVRHIEVALGRSYPWPLWDVVKPL